jgi:hypothetical protein
VKLEDGTVCSNMFYPYTSRPRLDYLCGGRNVYLLDYPNTGKPIWTQYAVGLSNGQFTDKRLEHILQAWVPLG